MSSAEERLQRIEDQLAIYNAVSAYGPSVDGMNVAVLGSIFTEDTYYEIGGVGVFNGREEVKNIADNDGHRAGVARGMAHCQTLPHVVIEGDRAVATCHVVGVGHSENGFAIGRVSASRNELKRQADGSWQITSRTNYPIDGAERAPQLLARLNEAPST